MPKKEEISEHAIPVQELNNPHVRSFRKIVRSVLILAVSGIGVGVGLLIYQLHSHPYGIKPRLSERQQALMTPIQPAEQVVTPIKKTKPMLSEPVEFDVEKIISDKKDLTPTYQDDPLSKQDDLLLSVPEETTETDTVQSSIVAKTTDIPFISLRDMLILKDHLDVGESCYDDLQKIIKKRVPGDANDKLLDELIPLCSDKTHVISDLMTLYRQGRKQAYGAYYRMNNPWWLAYIKTVVANVIEIRKLKPIKNNPRDLMSRAQNCLLQRDVAGAVDAVRSLPENIQAPFNSFLTKAQNYLTAHKMVDDLILSFDSKEK